MKSKNWIFVLLIVIGVVLAFFGFVMYAVSSIPYQDVNLVPDIVLMRQQVKIISGLIMMLGGSLTSVISIISLVISKKRNKK